MGGCSAGACPPLGWRTGGAEPAVPIRRTKPQLQLFIPWCPGPSRHQRLYESMSRSTIRDRPLLRPLIRHSRLPIVNPAPHFVIPEKAGIQRGGDGECRAGACPPLGPGAWQNPRCEVAA